MLLFMALCLLFEIKLRKGNFEKIGSLNHLNALLKSLNKERKNKRQLTIICLKRIRKRYFDFVADFFQIFRKFLCTFQSEIIKYVNENTF